MIRKLFNKKNMCLAALPLAVAFAGMVIDTPVAYANQQLIVEANQSVIQRVTHSRIIRIAIANPDIADVVVFGDETINIIGKAQGSTTLMVWTADGMRQDFTVTVTDLDEGMATAIKSRMHLPDVEVEIVGTGDKRKILLTGFVENQLEMELAENIAALYVDGEWTDKEDFDPAVSKNNKTSSGSAKFTKRYHPKIINKIQMINPFQVNLSAVVLDITDNSGTDFGIEYSNPSDVEFPGNNVVNVTNGVPWLFSGGMSFHRTTGRLMNDVNALITAVVSKNKGKVLSRPNVTTMSGKEAKIHIGGEIPSPILKDDQVTYEWKDYGITLHIKPEVDSEGKIFTQLSATVSEVDPLNSVKVSGSSMPAIISTDVQTSVTILDGQTMAIGGLMNKIDSKIVKKFPILGDIPILGELFKTTSSSKTSHDLVILLTPTLVNKDEVGIIRPGDKLKEEIEKSQKEWEERQKMDLNNMPAPTPNSKNKVKR